MYPAACDFDKNGFALRERSNFDDQGNTSGDRELTLKFRSADLFLVPSWRAALTHAASTGWCGGGADT